ncbi:MAG: nitrogen fixation protein NifM, partial [Azoarcus sp.]
YPELDEALFKLAAGQLSEILRSEMGFHIVRCDAIYPEGTVPYADVADTLRQRLTDERASKDAKRWLAGLLKRTRTPAAG